LIQMEDQSSRIKIKNGRVERIDEICSSLAALSRQENFQDVRMVCQDGEVRGARLVLALAFPHMEEVMEEREEEELVLILPHMQVVEVTNRLEDFLLPATKLEVKEEVGSDGEAEEDEVMFDNDEETAYLKSETEFKLKEEGAEGAFEVEKILRKRRKSGYTEYLVKWEGYDNAEDNTWEKMLDLLDAGDKLKEYEEKRTKIQKCTERRKELREEEKEAGWDRAVEEKSCQICGSERATRHHYVTDHIVSSLLIHPCPKCWEWFVTEDEVENHLIFHRLNDKQLACNTCSFTCRAQNTAKTWHIPTQQTIGQNVMDEHLATHDGVMLSCDVCGKGYPHKKSLNDHLKSHKKTQSCSICKQKFRYAFELTEHVKTKHTLEFDFSCDMCEKRFSSKGKLNAHQNTVHSDERLHVCADCGKAFKTKNTCEKHYLAMHTDVRPLVCSFEGCGKRFLVNSQRKFHERLHTGEKPYECDICGSSYRLSKYLQKHRMTHTGERPHVCQYCGKGFIQSCNMKSHQAKCKVSGVL